MNLNLKIKLDRTVGKVLCVLIRPFVWLISKLFLRRKHLLGPQNINNIVIAKYVGLGSIIQSTRLINYLKREFPDAKITYITSRENKAICDTISEIDNIVFFPDKFSDLIKLPLFFIKLWLIKIDVFLDLEIYSNFSTLITTLSFAQNRIGFVRHSTKLKRSLYSHIVYFNTRNHYSDNYISLGKILSNSNSKDIELAHLKFNQEDINNLKLKYGLSLAKPYAVFNIHASELAFERRWPLTYFKETANVIIDDFQILLTGTANEMEYTNKLYSMFDDTDGIFDLSGKLTFNEYLAIMDNSSFVLTGDTGPMHIAYALRKPTIALFGMSCPEHFGMETKTNTILYSNVKCSPCIHEMEETPCQGENICMQQITPDMVLDAISILKRKIIND